MSLAILTVLLLGFGLGAFSRKKTPSLHHPWLPFLALGVEIVLLLLRVSPVLVQTLVVFLVGLWAWINRRVLGSVLVAFGAFVNYLAVLLHGGMPVDPVALARAGLPSEIGDGFHYVGQAFPLGDWIPLPGRVLSPGDLLILVGVGHLAATVIQRVGAQYD